ncbi:MAG: MFS transporter [Sphaerochaeta sp.]
MNDSGNNGKSFIIIWVGQFFSIIGSGVSSFALSVWLYELTGKATPFALSFLCSVVPGILFAPIAGSVSDRLSRKWVMIVSDSLDAILKAVMAIFLFNGALRVWMVYPVVFISSLFSTFQRTAYSACIPMLVPKERLRKANGLNQISSATQGLAAPIIGGALYPVIGLKGLVIADLCTYVIGVSAVLLISIPEPIREVGELLGLRVIKSDLKYTSTLLLQNKPFLNAVIVFSVLNLLANTSIVLLGPMVLANDDSIRYGYVQTTYALSMLIGSGISGFLVEPKNYLSRVFSVLILSGIGLIIAGCTANWIVIAFGMFVFFLLIPYANILFQTLYQMLFKKEDLGRVGSCISALLKVFSPLAFVLSGPVVDSLFEPLMASDGLWGSGFMGVMIGSGAGRGCGLMLVLCGAVLSLLCLGSFMGSKFSEFHKQAQSNEGT